MGPSCRRSTRKSSSRRRTLSKKHQENSLVSPPNSPAKPSNSACSTPKVAISKDDSVENPDMPCNISNCSTPKAKRFRIPEIKTCPPAPKKRRILTNCTSLRRTSPIAFFASPDIELFFYFALRGIPV